MAEALVLVALLELLLGAAVGALSQARAQSQPQERGAQGREEQGRGEAEHALCWRAIDEAAAAYGAPRALFRAIALVESGMSRRANNPRGPWPWTITHEGRTRWFDTRAEAVAFARTVLARGDRSFDVGCMQINHYWHADAFVDLDQMLDPAANAAYGARFLAELHEESGDWMRAAGNYHSRTGERHRAYRDRVAQVLAEEVAPSFGGSAPPPQTPPLAFAELEGGRSGAGGATTPPARTPPAAAPPERGPASEAEALAQARRLAAAGGVAPPAPGAGDARRAPRLNPMRQSVWNGLLRQAAGALLRTAPSPSDGSGGPPQVVQSPPPAPRTSPGSLFAPPPSPPPQPFFTPSEG